MLRCVISTATDTNRIVARILATVFILFEKAQLASEARTAWMGGIVGILIGALLFFGRWFRTLTPACGQVTKSAHTIALSGTRANTAGDIRS